MEITLQIRIFTNIENFPYFVMTNSHQQDIEESIYNEIEKIYLKWR